MRAEYDNTAPTSARSAARLTARLVEREWRREHLYQLPRCDYRDASHAVASRRRRRRAASHAAIDSYLPLDGRGIQPSPTITSASWAKTTSAATCRWPTCGFASHADDTPFEILPAAAAARAAGCRAVVSAPPDLDGSARETFELARRADRQLGGGDRVRRRDRRRTGRGHALRPRGACATPLPTACPNSSAGPRPSRMSTSPTPGAGPRPHRAAVVRPGAEPVARLPPLRQPGPPASRKSAPSAQFT